MCENQGCGLRCLGLDQVSDGLANALVLVSESGVLAWYQSGIVRPPAHPCYYYLPSSTMLQT